MKLSTPTIFTGSLGQLTQLLAGGRNVLTMVDAGFPYGASFQSLAALAANTPQSVVAAASNTGGITVWDGDIAMVNNAPAMATCTLLSKATAPSTEVDGDVLMLTSTSAIFVASTIFYVGGSLRKSVNVPTGKRLDFVSSFASLGANGDCRRLLFTLN